MPLDFLLDDRRWTLHRWFLPDTAAPARALPRVDLIVSALGESVAGRAAIAQAEEIVARLGIPAINDPRRLGGLARDRLAATLADVRGVGVPGTRRVTRNVLAAFAERAGAGDLPLLVRPVDAHGGRGLERIDAVPALHAYLARVSAAAYDCSAFVDYRSPDGRYRKYRIIFVDGVAYPYHLAISDAWMVHYHRTQTTQTPWMNDEEALFLAEPERAIAGWHDAVPALAAALGLDYVGIDCAQLSDGTLLVFEADTAMLVHGLDAGDEGRHKRAAAARIGSALMGLFERRAGA
jgi:glutathione synthase/RimK-type ligase-like ATP-grasp enzyme